MTDIDTLNSLRERVLAASGPDYSLMREAADLLLGWDTLDEFEHPDLRAPLTRFLNVEAWTDFALALVERMLNTGRDVEDAEGDLLFAFSFDYHCSGGEKAYSAELNICREYEDGITVADQLPDFRAYGRTLPLAILAALLSALIAQGETP